MIQTGNISPHHFEASNFTFSPVAVERTTSSGRHLCPQQTACALRFAVIIQTIKCTICTCVFPINYINLQLATSFIEDQTVQGADKPLARPGRKQTTTTEDFNIRISYLLPKLEEYITIYIYN